MKWQYLDKTELQALVDHVCVPKLPALFDIDTLQGQVFSFNFYDQCQLIMLENMVMAPPFTLDYLQSGENVVYLDGSSAPFEVLNSRGLLRLNNSNIVDYLRTYLAFVNQRPNNILLLQKPDLMPYQDTIYLDFHFDKNNYSDDDINISHDETENSFTVYAPFVFGGKIDLGTAHITADGHVTVNKQVER